MYETEWYRKDKKIENEKIILVGKFQMLLLLIYNVYIYAHTNNNVDTIYPMQILVHEMYLIDSVLRHL